MIDVINISKHYKVQGKKHTVFRNLSLQIKPGERIALMGRNGAGKSTLLRILCGIEKPSSGQVNITSRLSWPVGVAGGFIGTLTGKENVKFVCRLLLKENEETKDKIQFVREFADIGPYFELPVKTYSSGMRSRLAFGLSMAFDFDFYIVDEALAVGDPSFKKKCKTTFSQKSATKGIIMVSHSISVIKEFCQQGLFLHGDSIIKANTVGEIVKLYKELA